MSSLDGNTDSRSAEHKSHVTEPVQDHPLLDADAEVDLLHRMELRQSLADLRITSNSTTARLDNTYYSVLEKFSTLQHSLVALQSLIEASRSLTPHFHTLSSDLEADIHEQIDTLSDYSLQEARIQTYQQRVLDARNKLESLSNRIDFIRHQAEMWSKMEETWEARIRRRIKVFWGVSAVVLLLVVGLLVFQYTPTRQVATQTGKNATIPGFVAEVGGIQQRKAREEEEKRVLDELRKEKRARGEEEKRVLDGLRKEPDGVPIGEDPRLRVFDEL